MGRLSRASSSFDRCSQKMLFQAGTVRHHKSTGNFGSNNPCCEQNPLDKTKLVEFQEALGHPTFASVLRREVYQLDLPNTSNVGEGILTRPDLLVKRLDCGTAEGRLPHGHPSMNGAASDFDPIRCLG